MRSTAFLIAVALLCAGCGTVAVPDAASDFKDAAGDFTKGLKAIDADAKSADAARDRAGALQAIGPKEPLSFDDRCWEGSKVAREKFDAALPKTGGPVTVYDNALADRGFGAFRTITLCDFKKAPDTPPDADPVKRRDPKSSIQSSGDFGADTLSKTASAIDDYVKAVIDLATNKTGADADKARDDAVSAVGNLAAAAGANNAAEFGGLVAQIISSAEAAKRQKRVGGMLEAFDKLMPTAMERVGHAGRLRVSSAIVDRSQAAYSLAARANAILSTSKVGADQVVVFTALDPDIEAQNVQLRALRSSDPMVAAQAFATAHHELVEAYTSKNANAAARATAMKAFSDAAQKLSDALKK